MKSQKTVLSSKYNSPMSKTYHLGILLKLENYCSWLNRGVFAVVPLYSVLWGQGSYRWGWLCESKLVKKVQYILPKKKKFLFSDFVFYNSEWKYIFRLAVVILLHTVSKCFSLFLGATLIKGPSPPRAHVKTPLELHFAGKECWELVASVGDRRLGWMNYLSNSVWHLLCSYAWPGKYVWTSSFYRIAVNKKTIIWWQVWGCLAL